MSYKNTMIKLIIWDLDGTLVNSMPITIDAFQKSIESCLGQPFGKEDFRKHSGPSEEQMIRKIVGPEKADSCINDVRQTMRSKLPDIQLFEGIIETLSQISSTNALMMGIFTGRGRFGTDQILNHLNIQSHFGIVVTSDEVRKHKPDPEGVFKVCSHFKISPQNAVMIGDSPLDILAGKSAGAKTIACTWDVMSQRSVLERAQPDYFIDHPSDLQRIIER